MHRRFTKYVDTQSHGCVVKCKLSADRAFALIREFVTPHLPSFVESDAAVNIAMSRNFI